MNKSTRSGGTGTKLAERLLEKVGRVRDRSAGILAMAAAGLLFAVCYSVYAAVAVITNDPSMFPPGETPTGFTARVAAVLQFSFAGPLLVLLAVMLLSGSLLLARRVPWPAESVSGQSQAGRASPLRMALIGLVAAAGLIALLYAAAAVLAMIAGPPFPGPPAFERGARVVDLALSLAALCLVVVQLSWWIPNQLARSPDIHDEQHEPDSAVSDATVESTAADEPEMSLRPSADVIETGRPGGGGTDDPPSSGQPSRNGR